MPRSPIGGVRRRSAVPRAGRSLTFLVEIRSAEIRRAAAILEEAAFRVGEPIRALLDGFWGVPPGTFDAGQDPGRFAWTLIGMWACARGRHEAPFSNFLTVEQEFFSPFAGTSLAGALDSASAAEALEILNSVSFDGEFRELLPYLFEPHGPGSRRTIRKAPETRTARDAKRLGGVFYTPSDVAEFLVRSAFGLAGGVKGHRVLDPACGTGVFLRAALDIAAHGLAGVQRLHWFARSAFGIDVSAPAVENACFVLAIDCLGDDLLPGVSWWTAVRLIRMNLAVADSLRVGRSTASRSDLRSSCARSKESLLAGHDPGCVAGHHDAIGTIAEGIGGTVAYSLETLFPDLKGGADLLVGNPPYSTLGSRDDKADLSARFACYSGKSPSDATEVYPAFVEMCWRLTSPKHAASMVLPLSIAFSQTEAIRRCRAAMERAGGTWHFAFFDREPHALFGEDVKTRNAILIHSHAGNVDPGEARTYTTPLLRWTSRTRAELFAGIEFTGLGPVRLELGLPKLGGRLQAEAFTKLMSRDDRLSSCWRELRACPLDRVNLVTSPGVLVARTAYNFLNVMRPGAIPSTDAPSDTPLFQMTFANETDARVAFGVLSSRLVFWLWTVQGDGFHVSEWFLNRLPLGRRALSADELRLAELGEQLWNQLKDCPNAAVNAGRTTWSFSPWRGAKVRDEIDRILLRVAGLDDDLAAELQRIEHQRRVVDESETRRRGLALEVEREE